MWVEEHAAARRRRLRRLSGLAAAGALAIGSAMLAATAPAAAGTDDGQTVSGPVIVVADGPAEATQIELGGQARNLPGLTAEVQRLGAATGDVVTVATSAGTDAGSAVIPGSGQVSLPAPAAPASAGPVDHEVTLVMATWPGADPASTPSTQQARNSIAASAEYWRTVSGQRISFRQGPVHEGVALTASPCQLGSSQMLAQVTARTGWTWAANKHVVVVGARCAENIGAVAAGWGSLGADPGSGGYVVINGSAGIGDGATRPATGATAHELGHNLSLGHSQELACGVSGNQVVDGGAADCRAMEYGNKYSIMGGLSGGMPMTPAAPEMARLGLTDAAALRDVASGSPAVDLTLAPTGGAAGLRFVRFTDAAGGTYYLEYRAAAGPDSPTLGGAGAPPRLPAGVVITKILADPEGTLFRAGDNLNGQRLQVSHADTYQLDANPLSNPVSPDPTTAGGYDGDPVLPVGHVQFLGQGSIIVHGQDASGARITVDLSKAPTASVPQPPLNVRVARSGADGARITFDRPASDGGAYIRSYTVTASPGGQTCTATDGRGCVISPLAAAAPYSFAVTASNAVGDSTAASSGPAAVVVPAPAATPTVTATVTAAPATTHAPARSDPAIVATQTYADVSVGEPTGCGWTGYEPCAEVAQTAEVAAVETYTYSSSGYDSTYGTSGYGATPSASSSALAQTGAGTTVGLAWLGAAALGLGAVLVGAASVAPRYRRGRHAAGRD